LVNVSVPILRDVIRVALDELRDGTAVAGLLVDNLRGVGVFVADADLRILHTAGVVYAETGEHFRGRRIPDLVPAEAWAELQCHYAAALAGESRTFDYLAADEGASYLIHLSPLAEPETGEVAGVAALVQDISDRRRLEARHRLLVAQATRGFDHSPTGMAVVTLDGRLRRINAAFARMLERPADELLGMSLDEFVHPEDLPAARAALDSLRTGRQATAEAERRYVTGDGRVATGLMTITVLPPDEDGEPLAFAQIQDVTARVVAESARTAIVEGALDAIVAADRTGRIVEFNPAAEELFGYPAEEALGRSIAGLVVPPQLRGAHHDGFTAALEGGLPAGGRRIEVVAQRRGGTEVPVELSISPGDGGRVAFTAFVRDISERRREEARRRAEVDDLTWARRIEAALDGDGFRIFAQPIVDLATGEPVQEELLIRLVADNGEIVPPGCFLGVAERRGLIERIDRWMVGRAAGLAAAGRAVEVNVSAASISQSSFLEAVESALRCADARPDLMTFEITETALADDLEQALAFAQRLTSLGCGFALDDFGTGYGALTYLKRFPIRYVKIDREFVADLRTSRSSRHVIGAVVALSQNLGHQTIAEGVEDEATARVLRELGVDLGQGYLFGRPAPA
jgi:PAS domain S-box-containing protein